MTAMAAINENTVAVCTGKGIVYAVSRSSKSSTVVYNDPTARFMGMDMHGGELSVVGYKGTIIHSTDLGLTWQRTQRDSTIDFTCCHRLDDSTLVIGATLTRIYVTTDNGRTILNSYQPKSHPDWAKGVEPVLGITHFGNSIFYTGVFPPRTPERYFNVYRSDDRGATWTGYEYPNDLSLSVWPPAALYWDEKGVGRLVLASIGDGAIQLCSSTDMGVHWEADTIILSKGTEIFTDGAYSSFGTRSFVAAAKTSNKLFVLARYFSRPLGKPQFEARVYESINNGEDLTLFATVPGQWRTIAVLDSTVVVGGDSGIVIVSEDLGKTPFQGAIVDASLNQPELNIWSATADGSLVLYSQTREVVAGGQHTGWIYTMDRARHLTPIPLNRTYVNDRLTMPFVEGDVVWAVYHEVDTAFVVISSNLVEWNTKTNQITSTDFTDLLHTWVRYTASIRYVNEELFWLATPIQEIVYDRATRQARFMPEFLSKPLNIKGNVGGAVVADGKNIFFRTPDGDLYVSNPSLEVWSPVKRCAIGTALSNSPSSIVPLGDGRYFVTAGPANYILTPPSPTWVSEQDNTPLPSPPAIAVKQGFTISLPAPAGASVYCVDLLGNFIPVETIQTETDAQTSTAALTPGMYVFVVHSPSYTQTTGVMITP